MCLPAGHFHDTLRKGLSDMKFSELYSESCQITKMKLDCFRKMSHLRFLTWFWKGFWSYSEVLQQGNTAQKMKFPINDFSINVTKSSFLWNLSHLLKKSLMENFIFYIGIKILDIVFHFILLGQIE